MSRFSSLALAAVLFTGMTSFASAEAPAVSTNSPTTAPAASPVEDAVGTPLTGDKTTIILVYGGPCGDCTDFVGKVFSQRAAHPDVVFAKMRANDEDLKLETLPCALVYIKPGILAGARCKLANVADGKVFVDSELDYAKRVAEAVAALNTAQAALDAGYEPYRKRGQDVLARQEAALAPVKAHREEVMKPIRAAWDELDGRINAAVGNLKKGLSKITSVEELHERQRQIAAATAPFDGEVAALRQRQIDALKPIGEEEDKVRKPFNDELAAIDTAAKAALVNEIRAVQIAQSNLDTMMRDHNSAK